MAHIEDNVIINLTDLDPELQEGGLLPSGHLTGTETELYKKAESEAGGIAAESKNKNLNSVIELDVDGDVITNIIT